MPSRESKSLKTNWEKFFILFLIINPIFDVFSGTYLHIGAQIAMEKMTDLITPTLIVRMLILIVFAIYVLKQKDKKSILLVSVIVLAFVLSVVSEYLSGQPFSLFADLQYIAKFVYNIAVILVFWRVFQRLELGKEKLLKWLNWLITYTTLLLSATILIPYALRIGYNTYGNRFGFFGSRGFFYSGNDITAVLMILLPICIVTYLLLAQDSKRLQRIFYVLAPAAAICALFLIGTKTAFLALGVTVLTFLINAFIHRKKQQDASRLKRMGMILLVALIIFAVLFIFFAMDPLGTLDEITEMWRSVLDDQGMLELLTSGRIDKMKDALQDYKDGGLMAWLFGIGRGSQRYVIEMDLFEVLFYYGVFGFVVMTFIYFKLGIGFLRKFPKKVDLYSTACFLSIGLCAAYLVIAGHVLFSVTSGFYFAFILLYAHLYLAPSVEELKIL